MAQQRPTCIPTPHVWPRGTPWLVMGSCIVEIDRIVIRDVQYQFEAYSYPVCKFQGSCPNSVKGDRGQDGHTAEIAVLFRIAVAGKSLTMLPPNHHNLFSSGQITNPLPSPSHISVG
ncbi:hypothetical protein DPMN_034882 [Dreissena polymorpha]|uniref:Uncharacterized protein n=1 Tax=Dreissena polymorpha TaxID=45954 RepID=A0A9D4M8N5_DREPO|nr:hypothetical protein DPMN_034882 [Dreissena polymorpha]